LRDEFIDGTRKGSGVWGREVDLGNMLQIELIRVNEEWREKGIATELLKRFLVATHEFDKHITFTFAWPTLLNPTVPNGST